MRVGHFRYASVHEGDGEVVQSWGRVVVGQVGVQVPRRVRSHRDSGLDAQFPRRSLRLAGMGGHGLGDVDVVAVAVVGMHSVGVRRRTLMCSRGMLHHPAPLDLHPLQHLVLMEPLHRRPQSRHVVREALVLRGKVLGQRGT